MLFLILSIRYYRETMVTIIIFRCFCYKTLICDPFLKGKICCPTFVYGVADNLHATDWAVIVDTTRVLS